MHKENEPQGKKLLCAQSFTWVLLLVQSLRWFTQWFGSSKRLDDDENITKNGFKEIVLSNSSLTDCPGPLL